MSEILPPPTSDLRKFVALCGSREAALALIEARGGTQLYVPHNGDRSELSAAIGAELVDRLTSQMGGNYMRIPLARAWRCQILRARGMSYSEIARVVGMTESGVYRSLQLAGITGSVEPSPDSPRQLNLF